MADIRCNNCGRLIDKCEYRVCETCGKEICEKCEEDHETTIGHPAHIPESHPLSNINAAYDSVKRDEDKMVTSTGVSFPSIFEDDKAITFFPGRQSVTLKKVAHRKYSVIHSTDSMVKEGGIFRDASEHKYKLFHRFIQFICKPIIERLDDIMASVQELTDAVQGLTTAWQTELNKISGEIKTLQDAIVANNGKIDPAALDPTVASINALKDSISAFDPLNPQNTTATGN